MRSRVSIELFSHCSAPAWDGLSADEPPIEVNLQEIRTIDTREREKLGCTVNEERDAAEPCSMRCGLERRRDTRSIPHPE